MENLTDDERSLLVWLSKEDFSQYGECYGEALNKLVSKGLAKIHDDGNHQTGFIARGRSLMHLTVSLTEAGRIELGEVAMTVKT